MRLWSDFTPALIIFDKDGTLIDFHTMWAGWAIEFARRLESACGQPIAARLFYAIGFEAEAARVISDGSLAVRPMTYIRNLSAQVLRDAGMTADAAERALDFAWHIPDPVALARPLADLPALFRAIRERGAQIAIVTADDRAPSEATMRALGIAPFLAGLIAADDDIPHKPAPDAVLRLCMQLNMTPAQTVVVGDTIADMKMARAAGVGLAVGVLSGVSTREMLAPYADVVIESVGELMDV